MGFGAGPGLTPRSLGEPVGEETVTLTETEIPAHTHSLSGGDLNPPNRAQRVSTPTDAAMFGLSNPGTAYKVPPVTAETLFSAVTRSEEHTSELQSLMRISYAVFCLKKKQNKNPSTHDRTT